MAKRMLGRKNPTRDIKAIRAINKYADSVIACRVYSSGDFTHDSTGNFLAITFNTDRRDAMGMHSIDTNTSRITVPIAGWYYIFGAATFDANSTGVRILELRFDGSTVISRVRDNAPSASLATSLAVSSLYYLSAAAYVEMYAYQNSGGNLNILSLPRYSPELAVARFPFNDVAKTVGGA